MQPPDRLGDLAQSVAAAQILGAHRRALDEVEHERSELRQVRDHTRADARLGRGHGVDVLVLAVDRQQPGVLRRHAHDVAPPAHDDLVVGVREPAGQLADDAVGACELLDAGQDVVDRHVLVAHEALQGVPAAKDTRIGTLRRVKSRAGAVVIGGGVGGCSIAYHLAKLGLQDVVLVEQFDLTYGSTWHSAGLVGQLRSSVSLTRMMMYSVELYAALRRETGKDPGWHELGGIRLASSQARMEEIQRQAGWAKTFGLPLEIISADEAKQRFPLISTDGVHGAAYLPRDGYLDPSQLTFALADGARHYGAEINTRTQVTAIERDARGRICRVVTDKGEIETEVVVDAAGMAAPDVARLVGVTVPIIPMAHQYLITEPFDPPLEPLPTLRDPDNLVYWRTEVGGLVMGGYERNPAPFGAGRHPPGLRGPAADLGLRALRGADGGLDPPRAGDGGRRGQEVLQRPRGLHARRRVHPGRVRGARLLGGGGLLRPRPRRRGRHRQGHGGVDRRGPAGVGSLAHGHPPLRAPVPLPELHAGTHDRGLLDLLRHQVPGRGAPGRPAAARLAGVRAAHAGRRQLRREVRLGARQLVRHEPARR